MTNVTNSKNKRISTSKEASELVGSLSGSSEFEDNNGPYYSSPSKKVKGDFFALRPLKLTQSKVNSLALDNTVNEM